MAFRTDGLKVASDGADVLNSECDSLAWLAQGVGINRQSDLPYGGEAIVSYERLGPKGTAAEDSPFSSQFTIAVTISLSWNCRAADGHYFRTGREPRGRNSLRATSKKLR